MPQYDGSIRINTQIDTKNASSQMIGLANQIQKTSDRIASLRAKMDALKDAKIPTQEYTEISKQIEKAESEFNKLIAKQEQMQSEGKDSGVAWERLNAKMEEVGNTIRYAQGELKDLVDTGKAFTLGSGTQEYADLGKKLGYAENDLARLSKRYEELNAKQGDVPKQFSRMRTAAQKAFGAIRSSLSGIGKIGKKAFSGLLGAAKKAFSAITSGSKKSSGLFSTMASRMKGIALSLLVFNWISKGFNAMISGMKTGFSNFAKYSTEYAQSVQSMKNAMSTLGNQFAAAFAPIVQMVIPWLNQLISALTRAMAVVAQFIAALTGKGTFLKAKKQQDAYNKSLGGTAKAADKARGALAKFDDLDVLEKQDNAGGGGGGAGGTDYSDMFEEQDVSAEVQDFVDKVKDAWENADFTEIGGIIGGKIKDALDLIPWDAIQSTVNKVAKSLATLLNGIVETDGLADTIGRSIAQAINTGIGALATFAENLHWDSVGKFIADGVNGALKAIDWETALTAAASFGTGIATMLNNALTEEVFTNIGTTIGNGLNTALTFAISFMKEFDFAQFGSNLGAGIKNAIATIDWSLLGETVGTAVQSIFDLFIGFVESNPLDGIGEKIGTAINSAIASIDLASFTSSLSTFVICLLEELSIAISTTDWAQIASDIVEAIKAIDWMGIASGLFDVGLSLINGLLKAFGKLPAPVQIAAAAIGGFVSILAGASIISAVTSAISGLIGIIGGVVAVLGGPLTIAITAIIAVGALLIANWDKIKETAGNLKDKISETWGNIKQKTSEVWESVKEKISNVWESVKTSVSDAVEKVKTSVSDAWENLKTGVSESWENIKSTISDTWDSIKNTASTKVDEVKTKVSDTFTALKDKVIEIWDKLKDGIKKPINAIIGGVEKMANGVINAINGMIRALNSIHFDIPDWVPGLGGKSFGFNLSELSQVSIPRLATGAVIRGGNPFMAVLGDQPAGKVNIEAPLDTIKQAVREELANAGTETDRVPVNINLNYDGQTFARLSISDILSELGRQGFNVDVLGVT